MYTFRSTCELPTASGACNYVVQCVADGGETNFQKQNCKTQIVQGFAAQPPTHTPLTPGTFELRVYSRPDGVEVLALVARLRHAGGDSTGGGSTRGAAPVVPPTLPPPEPASPPASSPRAGTPTPILLRVQDQCITSEVFHSLKCDCRAQLEQSLALLTAAVHAEAGGGRRPPSPGASTASLPECGRASDGEGGSEVGEGSVHAAAAVGTPTRPPDTIVGLVAYTLQEGRGIGLAAKVSAYALQQGPSGLDTVDANRALGLPDDAREYDGVADILRDLGLVGEGAPPLTLLTNNPRKVAALTALGVRVAGVAPCSVPPAQLHPLAAAYVDAKVRRMGHTVSSERLEETQRLGEKV